MKVIPVFFLSAAAILAQSNSFFTGQAARLVVGQPNGFTAQNPNSSNTTIGAASGIAVCNNTLVVADSNRVGATPSNNRVLLFNNLSTQLPAPTAQLSYNTKCPACVGTATVVLGQPDFVSTTQNNTPTQNSVRNPQGVACDGVHLVVADTDDNRVLIWNHMPTSNDQNADVVVGEPNFTTSALPGNIPSAKSMRGPEGVWIQNGKLFVADTQNNRVLIYNQIPTTNGVAADVVVGEPNFTTYVNPDIATQENGATASTMLTPVSVTSDGTRLFVSDLGFNRVLIFNSIPTANGASADVALGQPDLVSSVADNAYTGTAASSSTDSTDKETPVLCTVSTGVDPYGNPIYPSFCAGTVNFPRYALNANGQLLIADGGNDRVLIYPQIPSVSGAPATAVLGQVDFTDDLASDAVDSLTTPLSLAWDGVNLYVSDTYNRRINVYTIGAPTVGYEGVVNAASRNVVAYGSIQLNGTIEAGDYISLYINTATYNYTVLASDTLLTVMNALIALINGANNGAGDIYVTASADPLSTTAEAEIDLVARQPGALGDLVSYSASVTPATGDVVAQIQVTAEGTNLTGGGAAASVAPGTVVSIIGSNLSAGTVSANASQTLPTTLGGTQVYFNGIAAPLFMVSPTQINAQIPWELGDQDSVNAWVRSEMPDGSIMFTSAVAATIVPANPGIYYNTATSDPYQGYLYHGSSQASAVISVDGEPAAGSVATIAVNGRSYYYRATALDTLDSVRNALMVQLNNDPQVTASIAGVFDRIILQARVAGPAGEGIPITGNATGGSLEITVFDSNTCCANIQGAPVTVTNPAVPGELVVLYATGLGLPILTDAVQPLIQTGVPYPINGPVTQPQAVQFVSANAGGSTADVMQATMQPGTVGNFEILLHLSSGLTSNQDTSADIAQSSYVSNMVAFPLLSATGVSSLDPALTILSSHVGDFYQGEQNANYTLTITNNGGGNPTVGLVTVTETIPAGLTLVKMIGDGWTCSGAVCTRSDALPATAAYPDITVIVNVTSNSGSSIINTARVTGGGSAASLSNDTTIVNAAATSTPSALTVTKTHSGNFTQGQQGATYTITVGNAKGAAATSGIVTVSEVLPPGMVLAGMSGTDWTCIGNTCERNDALSAGSTYEVITVTVNVNSNATASQVNTVVVSGGNSPVVIGTDTTTIVQ